MAKEISKRGISPSQKLTIVSDLFDLAVRMKTHQLKKRLPKASDREIRDRVMALIEKGCR